MKRRSLIGLLGKTLAIVPATLAAADTAQVVASKPGLLRVHLVLADRREVWGTLLDREKGLIRYENRPPVDGVLYEATLAGVQYLRPTMQAQPRHKTRTWHYAIDPLDGYTCPCARAYGEKGWIRHSVAVSPIDGTNDEGVAPGVIRVTMEDGKPVATRF